MSNSSTDLVSRLRAVNPTQHIKTLVIEAADEIERLKNKLEAQRREIALLHQEIADLHETPEL